jgi:hypothetical protein
LEPYLTAGTVQGDDQDSKVPALQSKADDDDDDDAEPLWLFRCARGMPEDALRAALEVDEATQLLRFDAKWASAAHVVRALGARSITAASESPADITEAVKPWCVEGAVIVLEVDARARATEPIIAMFAQCIDAAFSALQARAEATGGASEPALVFVVLEGWDKEVLRGTQIADRSLPSTQLVAHITNDGMVVESVQDAATSVAAAAAVPTAGNSHARTEDAAVEEWLFRCDDNTPLDVIRKEVSDDAESGDISVWQLDSTSWGSPEAVMKSLVAENLAAANAPATPEAMVAALASICSEGGIVLVKVKMQFRATHKMISMLAQCLDAAFTQLGDQAEAIVLVLQGWTHDEIQAAAISGSGEISLPTPPLIR